MEIVCRTPRPQSVAHRSRPLGHGCAQASWKSIRRSDCTTVRTGSDGSGFVRVVITDSFVVDLHAGARVPAIPQLHRRVALSDSVESVCRPRFEFPGLSIHVISSSTNLEKIVVRMRHQYEVLNTITIAAELSIDGAGDVLECSRGIVDGKLFDSVIVQIGPFRILFA